MSLKEKIELQTKAILKKKEKEAEVEERKTQAWSNLAIKIGAIVLVIIFALKIALS